MDGRSSHAFSRYAEWSSSGWSMSSWAVPS
jgi:hypothetical protein